MFVVLVALGSLFVMHYARCIKADPSRSIVVDLREKHEPEFLLSNQSRKDFLL